MCEVHLFNEPHFFGMRQKERAKGIRILVVRMVRSIFIYLCITVKDVRSDLQYVSYWFTKLFIHGRIEIEIGVLGITSQKNSTLLPTKEDTV